MPYLSKRQHSDAWENVTTIDGSRWGFIGLIIGLFILVVVFLSVCIACLCRKSSNKKSRKLALHGSNLATTHPEPSYARPTKTTRPEMVEAEDGQSVLAAPNAAYHGGSSHASPSVNEGYGYQNENMYRNDQHDSYYENQAAAQHHPQDYQSSAYEQHPGEPEFEPVHQSMQQPTPSPYNPYQQPLESHHSHSKQSNYPAYESYQNSAYPQATYLQENVEPAPMATATASSHDAYTPETSYRQAYTSHTPTHEEPPAYPLGSVEHNHSMSKSQYQPPGN